VWVGYDSERSLGKDQTGGRVAAPIFLDYMQAALGNAPVSDFAIPEGVTLVSIEQSSGRLASPDTGNTFLEVFKRGSEPRPVSVEEAPYGDELDRAVDRLRGRDPDTEAELDEHLGDNDNRALPLHEDEPLYRARGFEGRRLDDRPVPRAEDYLEPEGDRAEPRKDERPRRRDPYRDDGVPVRSREEPPADDYRVNEPRRQRGIVEEPLSY
jgi:hypothetical protein